MIEYKILLPLQLREFDTTDLTFSINHIRSRKPSVIYFILHLFNVNKEEIYMDNGVVTISANNYTEVAYKSPRNVVGTKFSPEGRDYIQTFDIPRELINESVYVQLELRTLGIDSENPLYFSEMMLQTGTSFNGYHVPSELTNSHAIELPSNDYVNLYDSNDNYLQVIRPNKDAFNTNNLSKSLYTILAPHFEDEEEIDNHVAVYLECMNQTEQTINILR